MTQKRHRHLGAALATCILACSPAWADVDGDGHLDLIVANVNQANQVCFGDGTGAFDCLDVSPDTNTSTDVGVGDLNRDGHPDVVFANSDQPNRVCLGDGAGGFLCADVSADTRTSMGVGLGDVDGDGNLDAVFANDGQSNRVCFGDGVGAFDCTDVSSDTRRSLCLGLADVDGDGNLDGVFANRLQPNRTCLGDGTGGFACSDASSDTRFVTDLEFGDINEDGDLDFVLTNSIDRSLLCLGDGIGGFVCSEINSNDAFGVALDDVNQDRHLDALFMTDRTDRICLGDGAGTFVCSDVSEEKTNGRDAELADLDGDGDLDAVLGVFREPNRVCLADGEGGFTCADLGADERDTIRLGVSPPRGRLLGSSVAGMSLERVACRDLTTGENGSDGDPEGTAWVCSDLGVIAGPGDRVVLLSEGSAQGVGSVGGTVSGLDPAIQRSVSCRNLTTALTVRFSTAADSWDCQTEGLIASPGDRVQQIVRGVV